MGKKFLKMTRKMAILVRLVLIALAFFTIAHLLCCGYMGVQTQYLLGEDEEFEGDIRYSIVLTTVSAHGSSCPRSLGSLQVLANMFAAGLPPASTKNEYTFLSFTMCIGALCSAVIFGSVATIIGESNEDESRYSKFMATLGRRMQHKQLPKHIRERVLHHYVSVMIHTLTTT